MKINNSKLPLVSTIESNIEPSIESNIEPSIETKVTFYNGTTYIHCVKTVKRNTDIRVVVNDMPSQIIYNEDGTVSSKEWMDNKSPHKRANGKPYFIGYFPSGEVRKEMFAGDVIIDVEYELLPRHHMKSKTWVYSKPRKDIINNPISYEEYNHNGLIVLRKRVIAVQTESMEPTLEVWDPSGKVKLEERWEMYDKNYYIQFHRVGGPSHILYDATGKTYLVKWYTNGKLDMVQ